MAQGRPVLLRLLAGIYKTYTGTLLRTNNFFFISSPAAGFHPNLNFFNNIKRILAYHDLDKINYSNLNYLIKEFEFENYLNYEFKDLSQGYKLRVSIIIFLLASYQNLLADEFIGFGDKFIIEKFNQIISKKFLNLKTLVIASHNEKLIHKFCNRIIYLRAGKIIKDIQI